MGLYTGTEDSMLSAKTTAYNNALSDYQNKIAAYNSYVTWLSQNPGAASTASAQQNKVAKYNAMEAAKQFAADRKIDVEDYQSFLDQKYTLALNTEHPELAPALAQIAANGAAAVAQAAATGAAGVEQAKGEASLSVIEAENKKKTQNIILYSVIGLVVLIIGFAIYKKMKNGKSNS